MDGDFAACEVVLPAATTTIANDAIIAYHAVVAGSATTHRAVVDGSAAAASTAIAERLGRLGIEKSHPGKRSSRKRKCSELGHASISR